MQAGTKMKRGSQPWEDLQVSKRKHSGPDKPRKRKEASIAEGEGSKAGNEARGRLEPVHPGPCKP